jgi:bacterioferritin-associated ferredoxin
VISRRHLVLGAIALAVALVLYALFAVYDKRRQQRAVIALVAQSTAQLRDALGNAPPAGLAERLDASLQAAKAPRDPQLAAAAEQYLHTAREIARRRAAAGKLGHDAAQARQALAAHLARASSRNAAWIHQATELRKKVEQAHFDLGLALKATDGLLRDLPQAAQGLPPEVVIDPAAVQQARARTQAEAKQAADAKSRLLVL